MFHALRTDVENGNHEDVEDDPADELLGVHFGGSREVVGHVLIAGGDAGEDVLNAEAAGPRLDGEPNEAEDDALDEGEVLTVDAPDQATEYWETCSTSERRSGLLSY